MFQSWNLLRRVWEKYLIVFAMSTPDGKGTELWRRRWWKSWRLRSFAWTAEKNKMWLNHCLLNVLHDWETFCTRDFQRRHFYFRAKIFIFKWKIHQVLLTSGGSSAHIDKLYSKWHLFFPFHLSTTHLDKLSLSANLIREQ